MNTKLQTPNWNTSWSEIGTVESTENGVVMMCAKELVDGWHYAIVAWYYHSPSVLMEMANGKVIFGDDDA